MKFESQVETIFKKFADDTLIGKSMNEYERNVIKRYFQKCWEIGHTQGYADYYYDHEIKND